MTHNLSSVLSENFMERIMIKIRDDIIANGNKDKAENNVNDTDKIIERPVDGTIEGK